MKIITINIQQYLIDIMKYLKGKKDKAGEFVIVSRSEFIRGAIINELKKTFKFLIDFENLKEKTEEVKS